METPATNNQLYIVVLGHLMERNGSLNNETLQRVTYATKLEEELLSKALILCGWDYRSDSNITLAASMKKQIALSQPDLLPKSLVQTLSRDTVGDAFFTRVLLEHVYQVSDPDIVVVTSDYHAKRALAIFEFVFYGYAKHVRVEGCEFKGNDNPLLLSELNSMAAFNKTFFRIKDGEMACIRDAMASDHPFYNGSVYPLIKSLDLITEELQRLNLTS